MLLWLIVMVFCAVGVVSAVYWLTVAAWHIKEAIRRRAE